MVTTIAFEPEMQGLEAEIVREAQAGRLAADRCYLDVLGKRIESADRGEVASDEEVSAFFTRYAS